MLRVIPIQEDDGNRLYREFFEPTFVSQRLGHPGRWQGEAAPKLGLKDRVQLDAFTSVLHGQRPDGEPLRHHDLQQSTEISAWRITLAEEGPASVALWALSPPAYRVQIREAHHRAVCAAIGDFGRDLNGRPWFDNPDAPARKSVLFAEFEAGATRQQAPRLHSNLFLFNHRFERGARTGTFSSEEVMERCTQMEAVYTKRFDQEMSRLLGHRVALPPELAARFECHPPLGAARPRDRWAPRGLESRKLFAAWQEQGRGWGWGPERVGKLIEESRSRETWANWKLDGGRLLRAWAIYTRRPAHSPWRIGEGMARGLEERRSQSTPSKAQGSTQQSSQSHSMSP